MSEAYHFYGATTYINRPRDTVIQDFQNLYLDGASPNKKILEQLGELVDAIMRSQELPPPTKNEALVAIHDVADQIKSGKGNKLSWRAILNAVSELVAGAADIAKPVAEIANVIAKMLA